MEILIPGLILVALMVYASTRIKRSAAKAFEAETIDNDQFVIKKPEGFLNVIGGDKRYAFEAYSKEFGRQEANEWRQATAYVTIGPRPATHKEADVVNKRSEVRGGVSYKIVESRRTEKEVGFRILSKTAERNGKLYALEITALAENPLDFMHKIEAMLDSFEVK